MNRVRSLGAAVVIVVLTACQARAANTIGISGVTPGCGNISVSGPYSVDTGYTLVGITLEARPSGCGCGQGGAGASSDAMFGMYSVTFTVPSGTYDVQTILQVSDGCGNTYSFFSSTTSVTMP